VTPDVVSLAKALGGGLPIGALLARADLSFAPGEHGSTFGGGPVPSSAALAVLDAIAADDLLTNVRAMGALLRHDVERLAPGGALADVRGDGLLLGFQLAPPIVAADLVTALRSRGVLASTAGPEVIRFTPPYTIGPAEVDEAAKALADALAEIAA
jgi:acetylornithine/N-succinyldiaminopimelate aminotransferase